MVGGYSSTDEYIGLSQYSVGRPNIMHLILLLQNLPGRIRFYLLPGSSVPCRLQI